MIQPRFGLWAPVCGPWVARHHPAEPSQTSYSFSREVVVEAERLGFCVVMIAQHIIDPLNNDYHQLETWTVAAALAEATERIELIGDIRKRTNWRTPISIPGSIWPSCLNGDASMRCFLADVIGLYGDYRAAGQTVSRMVADIQSLSMRFGNPVTNTR